MSEAERQGESAMRSDDVLLGMCLQQVNFIVFL